MASAEFSRLKITEQSTFSVRIASHIREDPLLLYVRDR